jgi:hypothetical protein
MRVIAPAPRQCWRSVLADDSRALPEHAPEWIDAMADSGSYADASRLYEFKDGRRFVLPLARRRGAGVIGGWYGSYPPAWGIGGLVGAGVDAGVVRAVLDDLHGLRAGCILVRPDPQQADAWAGATGPDITVIPRRAHVIDLSGGPEAVRKRMSSTALRGIRTAEKSGVTVERGHGGDFIPIYFDLYASSVARWAEQQREPLALAKWRASRRDPVDKMYYLSKRMGSAFQVYVAFVDGQPAAASITLIGNTAHDTRAAMNREIAGKPRANELLQWTTIREACDAGCTAYHLGESGSSTTLAKYKEKFGARPVNYAEYRIERLPVTRIDTVLRTGVKRLIGFRDAV